MLCHLVSKIRRAVSEPTVWTFNSVPIGGLDVDYDGSTYWTVVGAGGKLYTATNPTGTWTAQTSGFGTDNITGIVYGGGYWVAVGGNTKLAYATDPTGTWTHVTLPNTGSLWDVHYNGTYWIATGNSGVIFHATDPSGVWTQHNISWGSYPAYSIFYGDGYWVAVGGGVGVPKLSYAIDPTAAWTAKTVTGPTDEYFSVRFGDDGYWLAGSVNGGGGRLSYISGDPTGTWTTQPAAFTGAYIFSLLYYRGVWLGGGLAGELRSATDPIAFPWTPQTSNLTDQIRSIKVGGGYWVAIQGPTNAGLSTSPIT